jgi:transposase
MLTRMSDEDWTRVREVFRACRSRRGAKGRNDRRFLEAIHDFAVHNVTWRALPEAFGNWNSVWMVDSQTTNSALSAAVS